MIALGNVVKDRLTDLQGVVSARTEYLYGSTVVYIEMPLYEGKLQGIWLNEDRVILVSE